MTTVNNTENNVASRVEEALERFADEIAKVDIKVADQIKPLEANLSGKIRGNCAGLSNEIKKVPNRCSKMEIGLINAAKYKHPKLGDRMKAFGQKITNKVVHLV